MMHAAPVTLSIPDILSVVGALPLCLLMFGFCCMGAVTSAALVSIRARPRWIWLLVSAGAWFKAFLAFLYVYAVQIADSQNADLGLAHFVLIGVIGTGALLFDLEQAAHRRRRPAAGAQSASALST